VTVQGRETTGYRIQDILLMIGLKGKKTKEAFPPKPGEFQPNVGVKRGNPEMGERYTEIKLTIGRGKLK